MAAYGSSVSLLASEEELVDIYSGFVEAGFKMVKMKVGRRNSNEDVERVKLVRETIGPNVDLAIDVNSGWSLNAAIRMSAKLEKYNIYWLEEPLPPDELDNHVKLAKEISIPIALGETHATKWEFRELMEQGAVQFVQADIVRTGWRNRVGEDRRHRRFIRPAYVPPCNHRDRSIAGGSCAKWTVR